MCDKLNRTMKLCNYPVFHLSARKKRKLMWSDSWHFWQIPSDLMTREKALIYKCNHQKINIWPWFIVKLIKIDYKTHWAMPLIIWECWDLVLTWCLVWDMGHQTSNGCHKVKYIKLRKTQVDWSIIAGNPRHCETTDMRYSETRTFHGYTLADLLGCS